VAKKRRKSRSKGQKKQNKLLKKFPFLRFFVTRFGVLSFSVVVLIAAGSWFFMSDAQERALFWIKDTALRISADSGFTVREVLIVDTQRADPKTIVALLNIRSGDPLFSVSPHAARGQVEKLEWVKHARVERRLSGDIIVAIDEYQPLALWHDGQHFHVVSKEGRLVTRAKPGTFGDFLVLYGEDAPKAAPEFFGVLADFPDLRPYLRGARYVAKRRWDLIHKNGMILKLSGHAMKDSLQRLLSAHLEENLLNKDLKSVDLRNEDRLIIRAKLGDAQKQNSDAQ